MITNDDYKCDYLIVGAGLSGCVIAERLANELNKKVFVLEKRDHIGGNVFDCFDSNGILIHKYGPHIFHTNSTRVFEYLSKYTEWDFYEHSVLAKLNGEYYPVPINRDTINQFFGKQLATEEEVKEFLDTKREKRFPITNSEDVIVNQVGKELFESFFENYTKKQWGYSPKDLAPLVCGRIHPRLNDDSRYFTDQYQFMPRDGFAKMFERILVSDNIRVLLNKDYHDVAKEIEYENLIYTGPIDRYFDYKFGKLSYRSFKIEFEKYPEEKYLPAPVVNYMGKEQYHRKTEFKQLTGQKSDSTTIGIEYAQNEGEPCYPVLTKGNKDIYRKYSEEADKISGKVRFLGRLAEYRYYTMDECIARALHFFDDLKDELQ